MLPIDPPRPDAATTEGGNRKVRCAREAELRKKNAELASAHARLHSLVSAAREVVRANRSYLEHNPHAANNPDALTLSIARLAKEIGHDH